MREVGTGPTRIPNMRTVMLSVRLPSDDFARLCEEASSAGVTISALVRDRVCLGCVTTVALSAPIALPRPTTQGAPCSY